MTSYIQKTFKLFLSEKSKNKVEKSILIISIFGYITHLILIYLSQFGLIQLHVESDLLSSPIAAVYTPFTFILIYEVYTVVYFLPKSITTYIRKQYEIITLIVIRRLFKDLANIELSSNWFEIADDLQFTYDLVASLLLFFLLYYFMKHSKKIESKRKDDLPPEIKKFINFKRVMASILIPLLFTLAAYTFITYFSGFLFSLEEGASSFKNVNNIFFDEFFTVLIIADVILLLLSFFHTDEFHKIIRNSGFIISTILIRLSFSIEGPVNSVVIVCSALFGFLILLIHNKFENANTKNIDETA